jgi:hypothetical protein
MRSCLLVRPHSFARRPRQVRRSASAVSGGPFSPPLVGGGALGLDYSVYLREASAPTSHLERFLDQSLPGGLAAPPMHEYDSAHFDSHPMLSLSSYSVRPCRMRNRFFMKRMKSRAPSARGISCYACSILHRSARMEKSVLLAINAEFSFAYIIMEAC